MPNLLQAQHIRQCTQAAVASRLNPHLLSDGELRLLHGRVDPSYFRPYLQIRNDILRAWTRNPLVTVTRDEAIEAADDRRYHDLALLAHEWLARNGYINFGCVGIPQVKCGLISDHAPQRTVVIVGAGVAALSCARQLQSLFHQFADRWIKQYKEQLPNVVLVEGRKRVGGRICSHPLRDQQPGTLPHGLANVAELGAQIITGFESGNPLDPVIRGQLTLDYHLLKDNMLLYDCDGSIVDDDTDARMQDFFNDILELASDHPLSWKPAVKVPTSDGLRTTLAPAPDPLHIAPKDPREPLPPSTTGFSPSFVSQNGKRLKLSDDEYTKHPSLGALMDRLVSQEQREKGLSPRDLRVLNWHYANLEYGNAINVSQLSLGGWDQDSGNEFEGQHSMVLGGYNQLVRGLLSRPTPLDVRLNRRVEKISYTQDIDDRGGKPPVARVSCTTGEVFEAHHVVSTLPLGIMQRGDVSFEPALPPWKTAAMHRMGFGVLNKLILLFDEPFWPVDRDMFGFCNQPQQRPDSCDQADYAYNRGRFYLFWNCVKSTGRPIIVALLAGDAANETEGTAAKSPTTPTSTFVASQVNGASANDATSNGRSRLSPSPSLQENSLIGSCLSTLGTIFKLSAPPTPREAIVTRWRSDPFARGSYSYLGPDAKPGDYEAVARSVGNIHFAGEATCGTHPATVHGAFLSGLRAASEVVEKMIGPINVPPIK